MKSVFISVKQSFLNFWIKMHKKDDWNRSEGTEKIETIQDIAVKLAEEQIRMLHTEMGPKERTIFILGSKGVGKSLVIQKFFNREETTRPTLALEYSYGRRSSPSQQVLNVWELGSLENAQQLITVPLRTHGVETLSAIIMLDLSQPSRVWLDLQCAYQGLRNCCDKIVKDEKTQLYRERTLERVKRVENEVPTLELMPFPVVIVGGKYDCFMDFDPELKKHICRCLRSMAHLIGGSVVFYSSKLPKLAKQLRDTISHLGFGTPTNPFRAHNVDYNDALSVWFGTDSWSQISQAGALSIDLIEASLNIEVPQVEKKPIDAGEISVDPAKDSGFRESIIDEMRTQKNDELQAIIRNSQLRGQFESTSIND